MFLDEAETLGVVINRFGLKVDPKRKDKILATPMPATLREMQAFCGFLSSICLYTNNKISHCHGVLSEQTSSKKDFMIEALINGKIPPSILAGLDIKLDCIDKGKRDNIHLELCHQGPKRIICRAELLREGQGINTNRIIPIPYFKTDKALSLKFPEDSVYKKGVGKNL